MEFNRFDISAEVVVKVSSESSNAASESDSRFLSLNEGDAGFIDGLGTFGIEGGRSSDCRESRSVRSLDQGQSSIRWSNRT